MNWVGELTNLYDKNSNEAGIIQYKRYMTKNGEETIPVVLLPPFHTTVTAQIEVTINENGEYLRAQTVEDSEKMTIIPVTEKSASRTNTKAAHPLCDNLKYVAGDYKQYCEDDGEGYELYMEQINDWRQSPYSHEKVDAVYRYLKKGTLMRDLIQEHVLKTDETEMLDPEVKIQGIEQKKAFVRFCVRSRASADDEELKIDECWKDRTLQDQYIKYYRSLGEEKDLCYLTGNWETVSYLHSKKIRNEGDGAKLISANDNQNFTYRGRFASKEEAFAVGNETSQKLHNALKWIIRKQGVPFDTLTIVTWESNMIHMPNWYTDTDTISDTDLDDEEEEFFDTNKITAENFYKALNGYRKKVNNTSTMILMAFDAATTGRLAMVDGKQLESARYLDNIENWHCKCEWLHEKWKNGKRKQFLGMVGVKDIADILFGIEDNGKLSIVDKNGKKLYGEVARRMIPCIWDRKNVPFDYVLRAVEKASQPLAYKERKNWERVLSLACSFVKKSREERNNEEEWKVALDVNCSKRDYLYGRLLAVADRIEYRTYDKVQDGARVTNAKRYMSTFSQRPFETWKIIEENLQPYLNKLDMIERRYYEKLIDEICQTFDIEEFANNDKLDGLYLLGFHSQSYELRRYKGDKKEDGGKENE